jgi:hypothetical protein
LQKSKKIGIGTQPHRDGLLLLNLLVAPERLETQLSNFSFFVSELDFMQSLPS